MKESNALMASNPQFTVLVPLDEVYGAHMPRDRNMVIIWLNGMVSPYSIAMTIVAIRQNTGQDGYRQLQEGLEWLNNGVEQAITFKYISSLIEVLECYALPLLYQEGLNINQVSLAKAEEQVLDEWRTGYVTLTFNVHRQGEARNIIGTPYPVYLNSRPTPLPTPSTQEIPTKRIHYRY